MAQPVVKNNQNWKVYVIENTDTRSWYIGYTANLQQRLIDHNSHKNISTRKGKWKLIYAEYYLNKMDALGREKFLKSGSGHKFLRKQLNNYLNPNKLSNIKFRYRVNQWIRAAEVQLIDEAGKPRGVVSTFEAMNMAREAGMDLVEVNPTAKPPIAKIMDFGQFQYKQQKLERQQKAKAKKTEIKGVRLSLNIGQHDLEVRKKQADKFLAGGNQVRLEIILRGREKAKGDLARQVLEKFIALFGDGVTVQVPFSRQGGRLSMQIAPK